MRRVEGLTAGEKTGEMVGVAYVVVYRLEFSERALRDEKPILRDIDPSCVMEPAAGDLFTRSSA